jgi:hypothetical protein
MLWWLLVMAALAAALFGDLRFANANDLAAGTQWWLGALAAIYVAAWGLDRRAAAKEGAPLPRVARRWEAVAVPALLVLAALTRLWRIWEYPPDNAGGFEEFQTGAIAYILLRHEGFSLEFPLTNAFPALSFAILGLNYTSLRVPFLIAGTLAPCFFYFGMRQIVSGPAAWLAAALLAAARWPAAAARFADEIFFPIAVVSLSLWLLARALRRRRLTAMFWCALVSGDLFYAYTGYRAFPIVGLAYAALVVVYGRWRRARGVVVGPAAQPARQSTWAGVWAPVALTAAVWVVMLGPGVTQGHGWVFYEALHRHVGARPDLTIGRRLASASGVLNQTWRIFTVEGDGQAWANIPGRPMFDPITAAAAALALAVALLRPSAWRLGGVVVLATLVTGLAMLPTNLNVSRYFTTLIPIFFLIAFLFDDLWRATARCAQPSRVMGNVVRTVVRSLVCGLVATAVVLNLWAVEELATAAPVRDSFRSFTNAMFHALHRLPAGEPVRLMTRHLLNAFEHPDHRWYLGHLTGTLSNLAEAVRSPDEGRRHWVVEGGPEIDLTLSLADLACAGVSVERTPMSSADDEVGVITITGRCTVPPDVGLAVTFTTDAPDGTRTHAQWVDYAVSSYSLPPTLAVALFVRKLNGVQVRWEGLLVPDRPGPHHITLVLTDARGTLRVGDSVLEVSGGGEPRAGQDGIDVQLDRPTPFAVELRSTSNAVPVSRLYWNAAGAERTVIPPAAFRVPAPEP